MIHNELALAAIFRDQAPYLVEWLEFHKLMGVDHFILYNNLSNDNYLEVLRPYIERGEVQLIDWSFDYNTPNLNHHDAWIHIQLSAYDDAINRLKGNTKWLAIIDTDEFLHPVVKNNLLDFLKDYEEFGGVCAYWQIFGTGNVEKILPGQLMIETLIRKAPPLYKENDRIKTIFKPERVVKAINAHFFEFKPPFFAVNSNYQRVDLTHVDEPDETEEISNSFKIPIIIDKIRINHYFARDREYFYKTKIANRNARGFSKESILERERYCNLIEDTEILRFVPELKEKLFYYQQKMAS